ncbi:glycosyltransferase family 4 protein [Pseudotamlana agarivorans]|uniref:glycosyltransferase family 4 protein n=1 Tax=Pseudotamlana agarivorans TaxID=481183 RepID=UPI0008342401|nr:glycosyltransferase family 4 protein [Tamlana agarivorans]
MDKKKLLYITNKISGSGGLERVLSIKASYLAEHYDYEVHIITLNQGDATLFYEFSNKIHFHDVTVNGVPLIYFFNYKNGIQKVVNQIDPHIICVCDDGLKGFLLPKILDNPCPMVYERHVSKIILEAEKENNFKNNLLTKLNYAIMDYGVKKYDAFVVLTNSNTSEWQSQNIEVISNPLSFFPTESSTLNNKTVIAVGKHCYQKGYDRLLKIWQIVVKKHPDWVLEIYGSFSPFHDLKTLSEELNIENNIKLFPPEKNIKNKFLEASIHVLPSRFEGFGMVLIEAMSCGLPVISFDCPCGPSDIINQNEDGILIENGDINAFSDALIKLIENKELRSEFGRNAKNNVERYLPENIVPKWDTLFKSLMKN